MSNEITEADSIRFFCDGLNKSVSAAKEMASYAQDPSWLEIGTMLNEMRISGLKLSRMRSMSRIETLQALNLKSNPIGTMQ